MEPPTQPPLTRGLALPLALLSEHRRMRYGIFSLLIAASSLATSCMPRVELDPAFAPRAAEVPMNEVYGFFPPKDFIVGPYQVSDVSYRADQGFTLALGAVDLTSNGAWHLGARIDGPGLQAGSLDCSGPVKPWETARNIHVSLGGEARLGCKITNGKDDWSLLYDFEVAPDATAPAWAEALRRLDQGTSEQETNRVTSVLVGPGGRVVRIEPARQKGVVSANVRGFNFRIGDDIVAVLDVSAIGAPHAFMARDLASELRPTVAMGMAAVYVVEGLKP